jgi:hypothetical protein
MSRKRQPKKAAKLSVPTQFHYVDVLRLMYGHKAQRLRSVDFIFTYSVKQLINAVLQRFR